MQTNPHHAAATEEEEAPSVILVIGSCGLDRLVTVPKYPNPDDKIRTLAYHEIGGGNAANTATALGRLKNASAFAGDGGNKGGEKRHNLDDHHQQQGSQVTADTAASVTQQQTTTQEAREACLNSSSNSGGDGRRMIQIRLLTKVGDDAIGQQLLDELQASGVEVVGLSDGGSGGDDILFLRPPGTTTAFTTIIVTTANTDDESSNHQHPTRTCLHTPGTCGELQPKDFINMSNNTTTCLDSILEGVIHLHSDSRHTDAALWLAREVTKRNNRNDGGSSKGFSKRISISCDVEKDRKTKSLDEIMKLSDIVFTNSNCLSQYIQRLEHTQYYYEQQQQQQEMTNRPPPMSSSPEVTTTTTTMAEETIDTIIKSMTPSIFFNRWWNDPQEQDGRGRRRKQVVVTQGHMGALLFTPMTSSPSSSSSANAPTESATSSTNKATIAITTTKGGEESSSPQQTPTLEIHHEYHDKDVSNGQEDVLIQSSYALDTTGVLKQVDIVDSTGAGDAFIAGYLIASLLLPLHDDSSSSSSSCPSDDDDGTGRGGGGRGSSSSSTTNINQFALNFGSWVAGQKLKGPGAQSSTLPWGHEQVDEILGKDLTTIQQNLKRQLTSFNGESCLN